MGGTQQKGARYSGNKVNDREWNTATSGHTSSVFYGVLQGGVGGGADMVAHVRLSFRLDGLDRFYQAAARKHHIPGSHVFGLQLPQTLLAVPDPVAKIHKEAWKNKPKKL